MTVEIFEDIIQGTPEWFAIRKGIPTASKFADILAKGEGKVRRSYMRQLAAEIITDEIGESYSNEYMDRGHVMENDARVDYSFIHNCEPRRVGFVRNGPVGWSPDSLIGESGALEIKTMRADLLIEVMLKDDFPSKHYAQCQGGLWVGEREWIDLCIFWPRMPLFVKRCYRDTPYINNLAGEVERFRAELDAMVEKIRRYE